ncbi:TerC family protein [Buchnera aphidicola]|uniref:TerC family protein n=1 Tax=Buchnera aphidicola TaxID=9 RepID=UPI003463E2C9
MSFLLNPETYLGLLTLIILEIVLGIDNLIFIAILSEKLPPNKRDKARVVGLGLSLTMRLILLSTISWIITLTHPIFNNKYFNLSGRDLILLSGGLFLLFKSTIELHEKLEGRTNHQQSNKNYSGFWVIIIQIVVLDVIFSLDSVITAVGMVNKLFIMMLAVIIATILMFLASKPLTKFINLHKTIVVLCLSFLLMIGLSLVSESFGIYIPKGYIYVSIGFSMLIECFNQVTLYNVNKNESLKPIRQRVTEIIFRLINKKNHIQPKKFLYKYNNNYDKNLKNITHETKENFHDDEKYMIKSILTLSARSIRSIMTPRKDISWINTKHSTQQIKIKLLDTPHSLFPVCRGELDNIIGIVRAKELLVYLDHYTGQIEKFASKNPPIIVLDTLDPINLITILRQSKGSFVIVANSFGVIQGLITPLDVLEAIAGEFPDVDETPEITIEKNSWLVKGNADLHTLGQVLQIPQLLCKNKNYSSLSGLLIDKYGKVPHPGDLIYIPPLVCKIIEVKNYHIDLIRIIKNNNNYYEHYKRTYKL